MQDLYSNCKSCSSHVNPSSTPAGLPNYWDSCVDPETPNIQQQQEALPTSPLELTRDIDGPRSRWWLDILGPGLPRCMRVSGAWSRCPVVWWCWWWARWQFRQGSSTLTVSTTLLFGASWLLQKQALMDALAACGTEDSAKLPNFANTIS